MNPSSSALLEVTDLAVSFVQYERGLHQRLVQPVQQMSFAVPAGEVVALVGASGAGKSLVAHAVLGMLPPNARVAGRMTWRGRTVDQAQLQEARGEMAMLPQSLSYLDPTATVGTQLRRTARLAGHGRSGAREAAHAALTGQRLDPNVLQLYPHQLSGGMGRRVLTALCLMGEPALVIADEPTPGLETEDVAEVMARLRSMADHSRGVLLITHALDAAVRVADRVVVCDQGRTVEEAPAAAFSDGGELLRHEYSRALWRALPEQDFLTAATDKDAVVAGAGARC